jgi:hypothetical protein
LAKKGKLLLVAERQQRRQAQMPVGTQAQLWVSKAALCAKIQSNPSCAAGNYGTSISYQLTFIQNLINIRRKFAYCTNKWVRILFTFFSKYPRNFQINKHS